ncbi:MAG: glycosyltransferase [Neisseriaceae bacterium]|nr:MAG: glycosyltransferase [Neisseriaceae bacterium]
MNTKPEVTILMSSYNGEKFITSQLYSLLGQTYTNWKLLIRDDGSTDKTIDIIKNFALSDTRIELSQDSLGNLGPGLSFWQLLQFVDSSYIMFCDQDDIWLERKIEICVNYATQNFTQSTPNLLYCNGYIYSNTSSAIEASSFIHLHAKTLADFLFLNSGYHGCCLLFDKNLLNIAREYHGELNLHDNIICLLAYTFGAVHYLNKSLMLYRQHPSNFTEQVRKSKWQIVQKFFDRNKGVITSDHYSENQQVFSHYKTRMSVATQHIFNTYFTFPQLNRLQRIALILKSKMTLGGSKSILIFKVLLRKPLQDVKKR